MDSISPKVTTGAVSATLGGGTLAVLFIWGLQGIFHIAPEQFTAERVVALTAALSGASSFVGGWLKKHGMDVGQ